ncbi:hypothetical protein BDQ17DRAFT_1381748 [Cyathus striatus]|nr:hypothetical protein BDQ17DRAFT_1381748 [Cyathus striatus]
MVSFATFFIASQVFLGLVSASPLQRRDEPPSMNCHPNFEGVGVSVTNSAREWGVSGLYAGADVTSLSVGGGLAKADFRFEQTGSPATSYIIKVVDNSNDLVVGLSGDHLQVKNLESTDLTQIWNVQCDFCSDNISQRKGNVAFGCKITSTTNNECVTIGEKDTDALFLADCSGIDAQSFDFWTATAF